MNLVDEQHIASFQVGQQGGQIAGSFQHRTGSRAQVHLQFVGHDVGQRCFAESGRAKDQQMVECLTAFGGGLDENLHLFVNRGLSDIFRQALWPQ